MRIIITPLLLFVLSTLPITSRAQFLLKGKASYYHDALHGNKMSNGEIYNRNKLTCAHLKLPFGTMLKVRNIRNNKEVIVEVTDRGPFSKRYILDLSRAAADSLGIIGKGFARVEISLYTPAKVPFRLSEEETNIELPELDLQYHLVDIYPDPIWRSEEWDKEEFSR